jgi:hypothetical protein
MTDRALLNRLCRCYGIAPEYTDTWGRSHPLSEATQRALLAAMGVPVETEADLEHALADYEKRAWGSVLAPVQVVQEETEGSFENQSRSAFLGFGFFPACGPCQDQTHTDREPMSGLDTSTQQVYQSPSP